MANRSISADLQTLLDNRLRYLPPLVGSAINSVDWAGILIEIGKKYGFHVDEMEDFQAVVLKSMIGLVAPENFESELISALALSPANAESVISQVNAKILEPIHAYIMNNGKPVSDPLKDTGIVIENENMVSAAQPQDSQRGGQPDPREAQRFEEDPLGASESLATAARGLAASEPKTLAAEKFEDYFITTPVNTDQTL